MYHDLENHRKDSRATEIYQVLIRRKLISFEVEEQNADFVPIKSSFDISQSRFKFLWSSTVMDRWKQITVYRLTLQVITLHELSYILDYIL